MKRPNSFASSLRYLAAGLLLLTTGGVLPLWAATPEIPAPILADSTAFNDPTPVSVRKRDSHLMSRNRSSHTFFINANGAISTSIHFAKSTSGNLNKGFGIQGGYSWLSRKGLGVGVVYSGNFFLAERNELRREAGFHYIGAEFVARQRVGRRWLFRESIGLGYGIYTRTYGEQTDSKCGIGSRYDLSVQYMLTRHIGLGLNFGGTWLRIRNPAVNDGFELNLFGTMLVNYGGGVHFYF